MSNRQPSPDQSQPDQQTPGAVTAGTEGAARNDRAPHRLRWLFLRIAASAGAATLFLIFEIKLGMPLSFTGTILLAVLVAVGLPLLIGALPEKDRSQRRAGSRGRYVLTCLVLAAVFAFASMIS